MPTSNFQPIRSLQVADTNSLYKWQTVQIQISWLLQKPRQDRVNILKRLRRTRVNILKRLEWKLKIVTGRPYDKYHLVLNSADKRVYSGHSYQIDGSFAHVLSKTNVGKALINVI